MPKKRRARRLNNRNTFVIVYYGQTTEGSTVVGRMAYETPSGVINFEQQNRVEKYLAEKNGFEWAQIINVMKT